MPEAILTDIYPTINYEKSILKQRLVYKLTGGYIVTTVLSYFISLLYMSLVIGFLATRSTVSLLGTLLGLMFEAWMIANIYFNNAFVRIEGKNPSENKGKILEILNLFYDDLNFQVDNEMMLRSMKPSGRPIWGRIITVIFDNDMMLLNITKLGRSESPTFIHGFSNYLKAKKIKRHFDSVS